MVAEISSPSQQDSECKRLLNVGIFTLFHHSRSKIYKKLDGRSSIVLKCENTCVYHGDTHDDWCDPLQFVCAGKISKEQAQGNTMISSGSNPNSSSASVKPFARPYPQCSNPIERVGRTTNFNMGSTVSPF
eukprot:3772416-Pyramimonas_sp.AAC.2